jgi:hypothetical protein
MTARSKRRMFTLLLLLMAAAFGVPQARVSATLFAQVTICAYDRQPSEPQAVRERATPGFPVARVRVRPPVDPGRVEDSLFRRVSFQRPPPGLLF